MDGPIPLTGIDTPTGTAIIALCIVGTAFFSSSEAAIIALSKLRIKTLADQGTASAKTLQKLIQSRDQLVGTILLAENALIVIATTVMASMVSELADGPRWPIHSAWGTVAATAMAMTILVVLLAEVIPKTVGAQNADRYALLIARPLAIVVKLLYVPVWLLTSVARVYVQLVNIIFRTQHQLKLPFLTDEEFKLLLADVQEQGGLAKEETEMIASVIQLGDTSAREIMIPRIDMVCLSEAAPFDEALRVAIVQGHSRIPVFKDTVDNIIGLLYAKDLLGVLQGDYRPTGIPAELIRPAYHVPESKKVDILLKDMRTAKVHLAVVLDEFGGTAGLITIEDILEEIVGEIHDEYDTDDDLEIQPQPDGTLIVDGRANIDDVSDQLGFKLVSEDFDTIGGFVVGLLGRAPTLGEEVTYDGVRLRIESVEQRRASRIRIWRRHTAPLDLEEMGLAERTPGTDRFQRPSMH